MKKNPYIRVGVNYFKQIQVQDRFGIVRNNLKTWNRQTIIDDLGKAFLKEIPQYDDFVLEPDNQIHRRKIRGCYNLYNKFPHKPEQGEWKWTKLLLEHVFGEQYEQGMIYLQCLYLYPRKALPVLVLVSKERSTGKSTFIDWLNMLFGANCVVISPDDLKLQFNEGYAHANIIAVEETMIDKRGTVEKIKALSTQKFINVNKKHISSFKIPFFGHIIMTSNDVHKFIKVDEEEIRFFVRELGKPTHENHNILEDMVAEIPAFLDHLCSLQAPDFSRSRMVLTPEEIENKTLLEVKKHSKKGLYKDMKEVITEYFYDHSELKTLHLTPKNIKNEQFLGDKTVQISYIIDVLEQDFGLFRPLFKIRYDTIEGRSTVGKPFIFKREDFIKDEEVTESQQLRAM